MLEMDILLKAINPSTCTTPIPTKVWLPYFSHEFSALQIFPFFCIISKLTLERARFIQSVPIKECAELRFIWEISPIWLLCVAESGRIRWQGRNHWSHTWVGCYSSNIWHGRTLAIIRPKIYNVIQRVPPRKNFAASKGKLNVGRVSIPKSGGGSFSYLTKNLVGVTFG